MWRTMIDYLTERPRWTYNVTLGLNGKPPVDTWCGCRFYTRKAAEYDARLQLIAIKAQVSDKKSGPIDVLTYEIESV